MKLKRIIAITIGILLLPFILVAVIITFIIFELADLLDNLNN